MSKKERVDEKKTKDSCLSVIDACSVIAFSSRLFNNILTFLPRSYLSIHCRLIQSIIHAHLPRGIENFRHTVKTLTQSNQNYDLSFSTRLRKMNDPDPVRSAVHNADPI
uniref:Uncharacterized protein n=1 Tax=Romanomermis culicivorax TaxID=13658 RepID=A0A915HSZ4_ROMCU